MSLWKDGNLVLSFPKEKMKFLFSCLYILFFFLFNAVNLSFAKEDCLAIKKNKVKVEAWLSKKYEKKIEFRIKKINLIFFIHVNISY